MSEIKLKEGIYKFTEDGRVYYKVIGKKISGLYYKKEHAEQVYKGVRIELLCEECEDIDIS